MVFDDIILDLSCVDMGIPPLSGKTEEVTAVIYSMNSSDRKRVSRKIKKLCKKYINVHVSNLSSTVKSHRRSVLEKRLGFKRDNQLFNKVTLEKRIDFIRVFILREGRRNFNETDK